MAKFPPDDDAPMLAPQGPRAPIAEDGNFKRGRFNPLVILGALAATGAAAAGLYFGFKEDQKRMLPEDRAKEMQNIFILSDAEQLPKWKAWAISDDEEMVQEALTQLALMRDESGIDLATRALARKNHQINGVAAQVLASYDLKAESAKPALLAALKESDESDRPQIMWALIKLREPSVFKDALVLYREGKLAGVQRVGGGAAFDPETFGTLISLDELAGYAGDESQAVRQLVATALTKNAEPKYTDVLIQLVNDPQMEVAAQAANGLGKIADPKAREPLLKKLQGADDDTRQKFLEAIRDGIGGEGLVLALDSVVKEPEARAWFQTDQIFKMLAHLSDPRSGDALVKWAESSTSPHWRSEAGMRLAEIGDIRGAKYLAERMALDPTKVYPVDKFWQHGPGGHLSRTDDQRTWAARMLADLAVIHPDKKAEFAVAEKAVLEWATGRLEPHANALRFLANIQSAEGLTKIREWSFPDEPLPKEGQSGAFPRKYETAQSALRYLGKMRDEPNFDKLVKEFELKKDKKMDITQEGLMGSGLSMLGMVLAGVGTGTAQGLAEWGDHRAVKPLLEIVEDEKWHEDPRLASCEALAWCANPEDMKDIANRAVKFGSDKTPRKQFIGACYAMTLSLKPVPEVAPSLVDLLTPELDPGLRNSFAQAIGASPLTDATRDKLFEKMKNPETRNAAALALLLGGDAGTASRAVASFGELGKESLTDLKDAYFRAFGFWSDEDVRAGNLYRWVDNAEAVARVKLWGTPQVWATERLSSQFDNLTFDNGPHSETRVVLRARLIKVAREGDDKSRAAAIRTLKFMKEKGVLMALRFDQGVTGELAQKAFFELMNPKAISGDDLKALQAEQDSKMKDN